MPVSLAPTTLPCTLQDAHEDVAATEAAVAQLQLRVQAATEAEAAAAAAEDGDPASAAAAVAAESEQLEQASQALEVRVRAGRHARKIKEKGEWELLHSGIVCDPATPLYAVLHHCCACVQEKRSYVLETLEQQQSAILQVVRCFVQALTAAGGEAEAAGEAMDTGAPANCLPTRPPARLLPKHTHTHTLAFKPGSVCS